MLTLSTGLLQPLQSSILVYRGNRCSFTGNSVVTTVYSHYQTTYCSMMPGREESHTPVSQFFKRI